MYPDNKVEHTLQQTANVRIKRKTFRSLGPSGLGRSALDKRQKSQKMLGNVNAFLIWYFSTLVLT